MSKLLINENPIMIIPSLALKMGLNEAVVLQQIHYWIVKSSHVMDGRSGFITRIKNGMCSCRFGQKVRLSEQLSR